MNNLQGILQALGGGSSAQGWASPEIQKGSMGQTGPLGQMEGIGKELWQGFQNSKFGQALQNSPIGQAFGQMHRPQMPQGQIPGMLGGQPPMVNQPPMSKPMPVMNPAQPAPAMGGGMASPYGAGR